MATIYRARRFAFEAARAGQAARNSAVRLPRRAIRAGPRVSHPARALGREAERRGGVAVFLPEARRLKIRVSVVI